MNSLVNLYRQILLGEAGLKLLGSNTCSVWVVLSRNSSQKPSGVRWGRIPKRLITHLGAPLEELSETHLKNVFVPLLGPL